MKLKMYFIVMVKNRKSLFSKKLSYGVYLKKVNFENENKFNLWHYDCFRVQIITFIIDS